MLGFNRAINEFKHRDKLHWFRNYQIVGIPVQYQDEFEAHLKRWHVEFWKIQSGDVPMYRWKE